MKTLKELIKGLKTNKIHAGNYHYSGIEEDTKLELSAFISRGEFSMADRWSLSMTIGEAWTYEEGSDDIHCWFDTKSQALQSLKRILNQRSLEKIKHGKIITYWN